MESILFIVALATGGLALGQYMVYNLLMLAAWSLRPLRPAPDQTVPITVVIPAYNEEHHIRRKLENLFESDFPHELLNVIVVDDGSTDRTPEIVRRFDKGTVRLIRSNRRRGKIYAQKMAFAEATTELIVLTDTTVLMSPQCLRRLVARAGDSRVGAVSGSISVRNRDANYLTRTAQFLFDIQNAQKLGESLLDSAGGLFGQLSVVRHAAVGDFSTEVIYEDREFGISLRERGYRAAFEPEVSATYQAAESLEDFARQKQRNAGAMAQSLMRHWRLLFNPRYGWYGLVILPEYALFRILRVYLLIISFAAAALYGSAFDRQALVPLLATMGTATAVSYIIGTAFLAPLVRSPGRFLLDIFGALPGMVLIALSLAAGPIRYFKGDFSPVWKRIKRGRAG